MNKSNEESSERLDELGCLLAAALSRMDARKSSRKPADFGECSLHFSPDQSGGVPPCSAEVSND